jgi:hypothetical protein
LSNLIALKLDGEFNSHEKSILSVVLNSLNDYYPQHVWLVEIKNGGAVVIKNSRVSNFYGFMIPPSDLNNYKEIRRHAMIAGGELLERAHLKRGTANGDFSEKLDGAEKRFMK